MAVALPGGTAIDYVIDGRQRRVGKKVNGALVQGFLYQSGLRVVAELDGAGTIVSRFVYDDTRANLPADLVKGGVTYRLLTDHLNSVRLVVNTVTGQIAQRMDYDAFGRLLSDTAPGFQSFGFAGGLYDIHTHLVLFGTRDYDAETGRWISKDPIGFAGGDSNLYAYVENDPVNQTDAAGLQLAMFDEKKDAERKAREKRFAPPAPVKARDETKSTHDQTRKAIKIADDLRDRTPGCPSTSQINKELSKLPQGAAQNEQKQLQKTRRSPRNR